MAYGDLPPRSVLLRQMSENDGRINSNLGHREVIPQLFQEQMNFTANQSNDNELIRRTGKKLYILALWILTILLIAIFWIPATYTLGGQVDFVSGALFGGLTMFLLLEVFIPIFKYIMDLLSQYLDLSG